MLIAKAKKDQNIVEYVLYMFQIQDMLRAVKFDIDFIQFNVANAMSDDEKVRAEIVEWYASIIKMMKKEGLEEGGNTSETNTVISELVLLSGMLLQQLKDEKYQALFEKSQPFVQEFRAKSNDSKVSDVLVCINALYGKLLLKLKKQEITKESEEAFDAFARQMAYLSIKYKEMYAGQLSYSMN